LLSLVSGWRLADPRLPSFPSSVGWLAAVFLVSGLAGLGLLRAGHAELAPWVLPVALLAASLRAARHIPAAQRFPVRGVPARIAGPAVLSLLGSLLVAASTVDALARWFPPADPLVAAWYGPLDGGSGGLVAVVIAGPLAEELWFRGVVLRGALARHPEGRAVLLSAVLFALAHLDPYRIVSHTVIGWVFGRWVVLSGSLVPAALGHVALNGGVVVASAWLSPDPSAVGAGGWSLPVAALDVGGAVAGAALVGIGLRRMEPAARGSPPAPPPDPGGRASRSVRGDNPRASAPTPPRTGAGRSPRARGASPTP
jgi:membrane protease YdiL (CAAX protease family)